MSVSHPKSYLGGVSVILVILPGLALPHRFLCHCLVKTMFGFNALILCLFSFKWWHNRAQMDIWAFFIVPAGG